jgi:hypothetical protein
VWGGQALEQILIGHVQATAGEANQIFRVMPDFGGEVEFKDDNGRPSGKKILVDVKSGTDVRRLERWLNQPVDVYLVVRQTDEKTNEQVIRWMNVTRYLKNRSDKQSRQIVFDGEPLTMEAVWKLRDEFFPPRRRQMAGL